MKKVAIITSAALLLFTAAVNAQTDTVPKQQTTDPATQQPVATDQQQQPQQQTTTAKVYNDKYNNWSAETYKMQAMPEGLTTEKIFPVIGKYQLTDKDGAQSTVTIALDEANKGIVWVDGLPQGRIKATLRKSPATYKIPVQPLGEVAAAEEMPATDVDAKTKTAKAKKEVKAKELPEGVLIYDKDANVLNVCIGCKFNNEDPTIAFTSSTDADQAVTEEADKAAEKKTAKTSKKAPKAKVAKVKPVLYTGTKVIETTAATTEAQQ